MQHSKILYNKINTMQFTVGSQISAKSNNMHLLLQDRTGQDILGQSKIWTGQNLDKTGQNLDK